MPGTSGLTRPGTGAVDSRGTRRFALGIEYDGSGYCGWQTQPHAPSVQDALELALSRVADGSVATVAAGRTDTGVHATGQVIHFDSAAPRSPRAWLMGANSNLPGDIVVRWAVAAPPDFHARYSATGRCYRYVILNRAVRSALDRHRSWWIHGPLDVDSMRAAAAHLLGRHDFSAFRASACQAKGPVRELRRLAIERSGDRIVVVCEANAFLHHMVRNIVGSLVRVGRGEESPDWVARLLHARDRRLAGMTAPASGLTLTAVSYPERFALPR